MARKKAQDLPEKHLLALHAAIDGQSLWKEGRRLLHRCFENHFIAGAFAFQGGEPMIVKRGKPAPPRDAEWWARNMAAHPMLDLLVEKPHRNIIRVTDVMSAEEIKEHPYYDEFMVPDGWLYSVGIVFREENGDRVIGMLAVNRREEQGDFSPEEMALFDRLYPHLETAFQRVGRIQAGQATTMSLAAMLSRLPLPVAVVSWQGEISHINDPARQACLDWNSPSPGKPSSENLSRAILPGEIQERCIALAREVDEATSTNAGHPPLESVTVSHPRATAFNAIIERILPQDEPMSAPAFLVRFERDSEETDPGKLTPALLSQYCNLTTAEKAVAELILEGQSNSEIAASLGKSTATVKKQAESIYRKLGIHDRRRLIALGPLLKNAEFLTGGE